MLVEKYGKNLDAFKTIGYREIIDYLDGIYSLELALHLIKRNTRHYARRQIIYLRRFPNAVWLEPGKQALETVLKIIQKEVQSIL